MVKTRGSSHASINIDKLNNAINTIFGRSLILRIYTETVDSFGQISDSTYADIEFKGDLQFGDDIDEKFISTGMIDTGDAVLYISPDALSTYPQSEDLIVDSLTNSIWEVIAQIEAPELGGTVCHYSYRCKRKIESNDTRI